MRHDGFRSSIYMLKHLEIWGIACALPAKKIATLIYLQPLGNMKGEKKNMYEWRTALSFFWIYWKYLFKAISIAQSLFDNCFLLPFLNFFCFCYLNAQERSFLTKEEPTQFEMKGWHILSNDKLKSRAWCIHLEMKAVYVCQSGKKQFPHNCSTFIPQSTNSIIHSLTNR